MLRDTLRAPPAQGHGTALLKGRRGFLCPVGMSKGRSGSHSSAGGISSRLSDVCVPVSRGLAEETNVIWKKTSLS